MKRILVHIPMLPHGEYDIFSGPDPRGRLKAVSEVYGGCPNWGNRLWFQGIISEISTPDNHLTYFSAEMTKDYTNSEFDMILAPMANVFSAAYRPLLRSLAERFRGIRIPVYVIACGIQADSFDRLDELCGILKEDASAFMSSVYHTGGEFALRGYFTKEFFDRLGFSSAVVTGCPSMYQMGRDLKMTGERVNEDAFRPLFNGTPADYRDLMAQYKNSEFFDQNTYFRELWDPEWEESLQLMIRRYGFDTAAWLLEDRIRLIPDMNHWRQYLIHGGFSMSYGARIHGSIMPILAGVPAVLECRDARTREMAEFFSIPSVGPGGYGRSLYELYREMDYSAFNRDFAARFDAYEAFLRNCGITDRINGENLFFHDLDTVPEQSLTAARRAELLHQLEKNRTLWRCFDRALQIRRRVTGR